MSYDLIMSWRQIGEFLAEDDQDTFFDATRPVGERENELRGTITQRLPIGWSVAELKLNDQTCGVQIVVQTSDRVNHTYGLAARVSKTKYHQSIVEQALKMTEAERTVYLTRWGTEERADITRAITARL